VEVKTKEMREVRASIRKKPEEVPVYTVYDIEGWTRYDEDGDVIEDESGTWDTPYVDRSGEPILPIGVTHLPLPRDIALMMAEGANTLFNQLSSIYGYKRIAQFPKFAGDVEDATFQAAAKRLMQGSNLLQGDWEWVAPPLDAVKAAHDIYKEDVREYYETSFQQLNDAARERTATEIRQQDQRGRQAYLTHLTRTAEEMENEWLWRLAQIAAPGSPDLWPNAQISRSTDFLPADPRAEAEADRALLFGDEPIPATDATRAEAAQKIVAGLGYSVPDDEDLLAEVQAMRATQAPGATLAMERLRRRAGRDA